MAAMFQVPGAAESMAALQASLASQMAPLREAMNALVRPPIDFNSMLKLTRPRIDIASTLPTYTIASSFPAIHGRPHDSSTDAAVEESEDGKADENDTGSKD
jgi:hypothetical protein